MDGISERLRNRGALTGRGGYNRDSLETESEVIPVTVCVAAICDQNTVIGASDRMLVAGDVQFEPERSKIVGLTNSIVAMTAGDASVQDEVLEDVWGFVERHLSTQRDKWLSVRRVAEEYAQAFTNLRRQRAERFVLAPLGLDLRSFIDEQVKMLPQFVARIAGDVSNFRVPSISTIVAGVDGTGAHLFVVDNGDFTCRDSVGFAAVGAGRWHANSQFMFKGHTVAMPFSDTLLLVYSAKKRAEVAPGVGEDTDMFIIGPQPGSYVNINRQIPHYDAIYKNHIECAEQQAWIAARKDAQKHVNAIIAATTAKDQAVPPKDSDGSGE